MAAEEIMLTGAEPTLYTGSESEILSGLFGAFAGFLIAFIIILAIGAYVYHALAWYRIAKDRKYKYPWLAWIPFANIVPMLELGGFKWGLVFLFLIPVLGWLALGIILTIALWRILDKSGYPGFFALSYALGVASTIFSILYFVLIGFLAWAKPKKALKVTTKKVAKKTTKKVVKKKAKK